MSRRARLTPVRARDRFLSPGGLMAPSHTRLVISGIVGERIWNERIDFWEKVYGEARWSVVCAVDISGFDMTTMSSVYCDEGLVEVVGAGEVVTSECILRVRTGWSDWAELRTSTRMSPRQSRSTSTRRSPSPRRVRRHRPSALSSLISTRSFSLHGPP